MHIPDAKGKCYGVFGLGKTGHATAQALIASGAEVFLWDDGEAARSAATHIEGAIIGPIAEWPWARLHEIILSPGVPLTHPAPHAVVQHAAQHNVACIGDVELLYRANPEACFVAITGTNGKSTTTSLIAHMLTEAGKKVQVGGNLGVPVMALAPLGKDGIYVLELSSYQLDLLATARFNIAVWLNISPDHLDRHGDMAGYVAAKEHIFDRQEKGDVAIIGVDDAYSEAMARRQMRKGTAQLIPVAAAQTITGGVQYAHGTLANQLDENAPTITLRNLPNLRGQHNGQNAAAAVAVCHMLGLSSDAVASGLETFPGLAHRMQWLGRIGAVGFVNDSKATNADAAEKALQSYDDIFWILGGVAKAGGIEPLAPYFPRIRHAYLIGAAAQQFADTLTAQGVAHDICGTLDAAIEAAYQDASSSGLDAPVILLAPACASFDQFPNFEARGDAFMQGVDALRAEAGHAA